MRSAVDSVVSSPAAASPPPAKRSRTGDLTPAQWTTILELCSAKGAKIKQIATNYGIPAATLFDRLKKQCTAASHSIVGRPLTLGREGDAKLGGALKAVAASAAGVSPAILRAYARTAGASKGHPKFKASVSWWRGMRKRHHLTLQKGTQLSRSRVHKCSEKSVMSWFMTFAATLSAVAATHIFNVDETYVNPEDMTLRYIIVPKGSGHKAQTLTPAKDGHHGIIIAGNAAGDIMPIVGIFPEKNNKKANLLEGCPTGTVIKTGNGWVTAEAWRAWCAIFCSHVRDTLKMPAEETVVLIADGCGAHLDLEARILLHHAKINLILLPPGCTHVLQPLDVGFFGPLKARVRRLLRTHNLASSKTPFARRVMWLVQTAIDELVAGPVNPLVVAFKTTGLHPLNSDAIPKDKFAPAASALGAAAAFTPEDAAAVSAEVVAMVMEKLTPETHEKARAYIKRANPSTPLLSLLTGEQSIRQTVAAYVEKASAKEARDASRTIAPTAAKPKARRAAKAAGGAGAPVEDEDMAGGRAVTVEELNAATAAFNTAARELQAAEEDENVPPEHKAALEATADHLRGKMGALRRAAAGRSARSKRASKLKERPAYEAEDAGEDGDGAYEQPVGGRKRCRREMAAREAEDGL